MTDTIDDMNSPESNDREEYAEKVAEQPTAADPWASDEDLAPSDGGKYDSWGDEDAEGDFDIENLRINLSKEVAESETFADLPRGTYHVAITKCDVVRSKSRKNPGKPMYNIQYTVQDGKYAKAKIFETICLWSEAAYSLVQLVKALGGTASAGEFRVPPPTELLGQELMIKYQMGKRNVADDGTVYEAKLEVKGHLKYKRIPLGMEDDLAP